MQYISVEQKVCHNRESRDPSGGLLAAVLAASELAAVRHRPIGEMWKGTVTFYMMTRSSLLEHISLGLAFEIYSAGPPGVDLVKIQH